MAQRFERLAFLLPEKEVLATLAMRSMAVFLFMPAQASDGSARVAGISSDIPGEARGADWGGGDMAGAAGACIAS